MLSTRQTLDKALPTLHYNPFDWLIYCLRYFSCMNCHIYSLSLPNLNKYLPFICKLAVPVFQNISADFALSLNKHCSGYSFHYHFLLFFKEEMFLLSNCFLRDIDERKKRTRISLTQVFLQGNWWKEIWLLCSRIDQHTLTEMQLKQG